MGANTSRDDADDLEFGFSRNCSYQHSLRTPMPQGKPSAPEGIPKVADVTHNSLTLSWYTPKGVNSSKILAYQIECCNLKDRKWKVITSTCQGTSYHVRNLIPNTSYMYRVRAENICGLGKPGMCSDIVQTKRVDTSSNDKPVPKLVRRHSNYIHLDGGVNTLLKRSEMFENSSTVSTLPFKRNSIRMSLPTTFRKRPSITSMLPGGRRESVCNFKESQKSFEDSSVAEDECLNIKRISISTTGSSNLSANSISSIPEEDELKMLYNRMDCKEVCSDTDSSTSNSNSSSSTNCHNTILMAPLTDDTKLAYFTHPDKRYCDKFSNKDMSFKQCNQTGFDSYYNEKISHQDPVWQGRNQSESQSFRNVPDLRSIREMLNSQDVMVKTHDLDSQCQSSNSYSHLRRNYCAIKELDEDDIAVDIVSTI